MRVGVRLHGVVQPLLPNGLLHGGAQPLGAGQRGHQLAQRNQALALALAVHHSQQRSHKARLAVRQQAPRVGGEDVGRAEVIFHVAHGLHAGNEGVVLLHDYGSEVLRHAVLEQFFLLHLRADVGQKALVVHVAGQVAQHVVHRVEVFCRLKELLRQPGDVGLLFVLGAGLCGHLCVRGVKVVKVLAFATAPGTGALRQQPAVVVELLQAVLVVSPLQRPRCQAAAGQRIGVQHGLQVYLNALGVPHFDLVLALLRLAPHTGLVLALLDLVGRHGGCGVVCARVRVRVSVCCVWCCWASDGSPKTKGESQPPTRRPRPPHPLGRVPWARLRSPRSTCLSGLRPSHT